VIVFRQVYFHIMVLRSRNSIATQRPSGRVDPRPWCLGPASVPIPSPGPSGEPLASFFRDRVSETAISQSADKGG